MDPVPAKTARSYLGGHGARAGDASATPTGRHRSAGRWTDVAARGALDALACYCDAHGHGTELGVGMLELLLAADLHTRLARCLSRELPENARALVHDVFSDYASALADLPPVYSGKAKAMVKSRLCNMQRHRLPAGAELLPLRPTVLPADAHPPTTFHDWLDDGEAQSDPLTVSARVMTGLHTLKLVQWPTDGVVVYERAWNRVVKERRGDAALVDERFRAALVHTTVLPTAMTQRNDQYYLVHRERYMSPSEMLRAFGIRIDGPLGRTLLDRSLPVSAIQASCLLGESVQATVARALLESHLGPAPSGLTYGSAFSGVDTIAEAVDVWSRGTMQYVHAAEKEELPRRVLARAWRERGLAASAISHDARVVDHTAPSVDIYAFTAQCQPFSTRNHRPSPLRSARSLLDCHRSLDYVRSRQPRAVLVENVAEASIVMPLTDMLLRIPGYTWHGGTLDSSTHFGIPMARKRYYWVGIRV